ncbi:alpha/beta hydrolase family protein [Streptomyces boninensis]|uniref:alpha/beta hydrolase family protein n=1 Tax=Streptomyces boninensis TaxID=2039455 RepID=UPI003B210667
MSTTTAVPLLSYAPVTLPIPGRPAELQLRVTAPEHGDELPVIVLSHGHGPSHHLSSMNGYQPLATLWAQQGFAVIQPTHLSSRTLSHLWEGDPRAPFYARERAEDISHVLDHLDEIEKTVPLLAGRLDREAVALAGHSLGGFTTAMILGARTVEPDTGEVLSHPEPRVKQGVLLAAPGRGGDALNGPMAPQVPIMRGMDFSTMTRPALVVAGDKDDSPHFTDMGPAWHYDPYHLAPGPKTLLTLFDLEHGLGGIAGYDAAETTDESPERLAALARLTGAYLRSALRPGDSAWRDAQEELLTGPDAYGTVESK